LPSFFFFFFFFFFLARTWLQPTNSCMCRGVELRQASSHTIPLLLMLFTDITPLLWYLSEIWWHQYRCKALDRPTKTGPGVDDDFILMMIPARVPQPGGYRVLELTAVLVVILIALTPDLRD
jgi:hypothetical protein